MVTSFLAVLEATIPGADTLPRQIAGELGRTRVYRRSGATGAGGVYTIFMSHSGPSWLMTDALLLGTQSKVATGRRPHEKASPWA